MVFKRMLPWMVMILISITLITLAAFVLWEYIMNEPKSDPNTHINGVDSVQLSAKQINNQTVKIEEVTTNLKGMNHVIRASFAILLTSEAAKKEVETMIHIVEANIIRTLADTNVAEIEGSTGMDTLISKIMNQINAILQKGKVSQIDITEFIVNPIR